MSESFLLHPRIITTYMFFSMIFSLKVVIATVGLILPGHALARTLGLRPSWAVAFPFTVILLTLLVIANSLAGVAKPLRHKTLPRKTAQKRQKRLRHSPSCFQG